MAMKATVFLLMCIVAMVAARWIWVDEGPRPAPRRGAAPRREFGSLLDQYQYGFRYKDVSWKVIRVREMPTVVAISFVVGGRVSLGCAGRSKVD